MMHKTIFKVLFSFLIFSTCIFGGIQAVSAMNEESDSQPAPQSAPVDVPLGISSTSTALITPSGTYGNVTFGRWYLLDGYTSEVYEPTAGGEAYWWMPAYNDSAWTTTTEVGWNVAWEGVGWATIGDIGHYAAGYRTAAWNEPSTWLHRNTFNINVPAGWYISGATIDTFIDDLQNVYINGNKLPFNNSQVGYNIPVGYLNAGTNVLALTDYSVGSTSGVQYRIIVTISQYPPTVDLRVNGSNGPVSVSVNTNFTPSWTSNYADTCTGSANLAGYNTTSGSFSTSKASAGSYTYTITCQNATGTATDSVVVNVYPLPTVTITTPAMLTAPAFYTPSWTSTNAVSCTGGNRFVGYSGTSGSRAENNIPAGTYVYSMTCYNAAGDSAVDTKTTVVYGLPTVDVKIDGLDGPTLTRTAPANYTATWNSTNASSCSGSSRFAGYTGLSGSRTETGVVAGSVYDYTMVCQNPAGTTVTDTVRMVVVAPPTVDVKIDGSDGPTVYRTAPAGYTATWTSGNATSCSGSSRFTGYTGLSGSRVEAGVAAGTTYDYTMVCQNAAGTAVTDTVRMVVVNAPTVDVKVDGLDGPTLYRTGPASYNATWTSANASSCSGSSRFAGYNGLSGTRTETNVPGGTTYDYTMTCQNLAGTTVSDTVRMNVLNTPTVDVKVDGSDGPTLNRTGPVSYVANWTSTNASSCSGSSRFAGYTGLTGSRSETNVPGGTTYDYTMVCQNLAGTTVTDTVRMVVWQAPVIDVKVDGSDGPVGYYEPANYTVTWTSANAVTCTAFNDLPGPIGLSGSLVENTILVGTYYYSAQCSNPAGTVVSDTVRVDVYPNPPTVDLLIDGGTGPITVTAPGNYTLSWTSTNANTCAASSSDGDWEGNVVINGSQFIASKPQGTYTYTITCTNISGSATDTVTAIVIDPLTGNMSALYSDLILYATNVGQPAQTLMGSVSGGTGPYTIIVRVQAPSGGITNYSRGGASWTLTPADVLEPNFGTTEEGTWTAWAEITDAVGATYTTNVVTWDVSWYPVHGRP